MQLIVTSKVSETQTNWLGGDQITPWVYSMHKSNSIEILLLLCWVWKNWNTFDLKLIVLDYDTIESLSQYFSIMIEVFAVKSIEEADLKLLIITLIDFDSSETIGLNW